MKFSFDEPESWAGLLPIFDAYSVDPFVPVEAEAFFQRLLEGAPHAQGTPELEEWLHTQLAQHFPVLTARPQWVQGAEWPYYEGQPMLFAGQLNLPGQHSNRVSPYHDDTSVYLFLTPRAEPVMITQQH